MRTIIIGDVHGMRDEVRGLIGLLGPEPTDTLVFAGDLVDKGPDSAGVVRDVRALAKACRVVLVEGNHEDKHRRYRRNLELRPDTAAEMAARSPELRILCAELSAADVEFLDSAVPFHRIAAGAEWPDFLVVHGGIPGDMDTFPATVEEARALKGKAKKKLVLTMRTRFIRKETGKFVKLGDEQEGDPFWADVYDGRFGHVVYGHEATTGDLRESACATGVDTGCVFGGALTAMVLEDDTSPRFVSVPGRKYAERR